ncbi:flagellar hook protein FliD [Bacillus sp. M6-12]|uniref:flagellar filament capping protein FliD n=1 Tax=Bacillus sp. M6-12 TaxID=2054166 RepID=UPI000C77AFC1|nr:flagellar filament capping protein FliD [Bacillus sp. M6-12]PLS17896.1 flagellar hook protein FliD [Bacillus sp. M6-12]
MVESIRFSGMASGMDTQSIVDSLMKAERMPLDRIKQKKQVLEWQRDDYREMNKLLKGFDTYIFDNIYKQSKMLTRSATSSNTDFVTATASAEAGNVSYKIENVTLATAARRQSASGISKDANIDGTVTTTEKIDPTKSLWSQKGKFANSITFVEDAEFTNNSFTVPKGGATEFQLTKGAISQLPAAIDVNNVSYSVVDGAMPTPPPSDGVKRVYINSDTGKMVFSEQLPEDKTFSVSFKQNNLVFDIKTFNESGSPQYKNFKIDGTNSLNKMFSTINSADAGVNLFYDTSSDKVVAMRTETGKFNTAVSGKEMGFVDVTRATNGSITENGNNTFFTSVLGLSDTVEVPGSDAKFTINGLETTRKSNTFTMNDVTFTLKKASTTDSATINVKTDTDSIVKTIKDFVDKYNELIGKINGELTEERFTTFTPLSDEQKAGMKEKEIEQWEEKAKSGMLRRDMLLTGGLSKMRMDLYSEVTSNAVTLTDKKYNQLSEIGIKTTKDHLERGKLELDEDKLKAAIEDNPEAVYQLFMADGTVGPDGKPVYAERGLARKLRDSIAETMGKIETKAGNTFKTEHNYSMGKDLLRMKEDITTFEDRLRLREKRYWDQFNAMESAMQKLNNQSSQLMAQLGAGSQG